MKLVTYIIGSGAPRCGALTENQRWIVDLASASGGAPWSESVQAMIEHGDEGLHDANRAVKRASVSSRVDTQRVRLLAPLQPPPQMRDCLCFEGHLVAAFGAARRLRAQQFPDPVAKLAELEREGVLSVPATFYEHPIYYKANRFAVIGTDTDVQWPHYSNVLDFELEFGIYIGRPAKNVSRADARQHIYGYTIFNDITARDAQTAEMGGQLGPAKGKDFDTGNPMGPCLVTADELPDPYSLTMIARVNGEEWTRANSRTMHWKFEDLIEHISQSETLHPGEFLGSGTVEGGCGLETLRFLKPDDVIELEVEGIGVLRNRVVRQTAE